MNKAIRHISALKHRALKQRGNAQSGAALLLALLMIVAVSGIALVLLGVLLAQTGPTFMATKGTRTVSAAEAGLQSVLGQLRTQTRTVTPGHGSSVVIGDQSKLPCSAVGTTTITGRVEGESPDVTYAVKIRYLTKDKNPSGRTQDWINANAIACSAGHPAVQPGFAVITSTGSAPAAGSFSAEAGSRTVESVYEFTVTNVNISGGPIWLHDHSQGCLAVSSAATGKNVIIRPQSYCENTANSDYVNWIYDKSWHIVLATSTRDAFSPGPLCIGGATGDNAKLQQCQNVGTTDTADWQTRWAWDDNWSWHGVSVDHGSLNDDYGRRLSQNGSKITISGTNTQYDPAPAVGAGAAGSSTHQLVNYKEFGRCADVTHTDIDYAFMITYPCKQDARGLNGFSWNHKWFFTEPPNSYASGVSPEACPSSDESKCTSGPQKITVKQWDTNTYCLQVVTSGSSSAMGTGSSELQFKGCTGGNNQKFTRYTRVTDPKRAWTIQDNWGRCLTSDSSMIFEGSWSHLRMTPCNENDASQRWNAPPQKTQSSLGGYREVAE